MNATGSCLAYSPHIHGQSTSKGMDPRPASPLLESFNLIAETCTPLSSGSTITLMQQRSKVRSPMGCILRIFLWTMSMSNAIAYKHCITERLLGTKSLKLSVLFGKEMTPGIRTQLLYTLRDMVARFRDRKGRTLVGWR